MLLQARVLWLYLRSQYVGPGERDEGGSVVETVIITAVFAALAIAIGTIIVAKITSKAHSIRPQLIGKALGSLDRLLSSRLSSSRSP